MTKRKKMFFAFVAALLAAVIALASWYLHRHTVAVLSPQGPVGHQERSLIIFASVLSLFVVIPVFAMTATIVWRYRASNTKATYAPELDGNRKAETAWWLIPGAMILVLSIVTWNSSHALDPYKALSSKTPPITIDVVALDWKWLFIYPAQHIASVNFLQFPANTPINFTITADAPMNSFWIPQLGGQIYAMPGMSTQLHLMATKAGDYTGRSANISGKGFAGMTFVARAGSVHDFASWVKAAQREPQLDFASYAKLVEPSENNPSQQYALADDNLYNQILMKYMVPSVRGPHMEMQ